jgi:sarcosine oxidase subunit delta
MRIVCPYCGERDAEEFSVQGEVAGPRPQSGALDDFHAYVNLRDNPFGPTREYWYHSGGCRRWLVVRRDTRDHAILGAELAKP